MNAGLAIEDKALDSANREQRVELAAALRLAVHFGYHEAIDNHFTLTVPDMPSRYFLNPFGLHWAEIRASDLLEVDMEGRVVAGEGIADRTAVCIHAPVHQRGHVCVLHTHMPYATALTQLEDMTIEMTGQNALGFYGRVAYDYDYGGLALSLDEGERLADILGDKLVLMLANHGVLVVGTSVADAFNTLYFLEQTCRTQILSMSTGKPRRFVPEKIAARTATQYDSEEEFKQSAARELTRPAERVRTGPEMHFDALKRMLDRSDPSYRQ